MVAPFVGEHTDVSLPLHVLLHALESLPLHVSLLVILACKSVNGALGVAPLVVGVPNVAVVGSAFLGADSVLVTLLAAFLSRFDLFLDLSCILASAFSMLRYSRRVFISDLALPS